MQIQVLETASVTPASEGEETVRSVSLVVPFDLPPTTLSPAQGGHTQSSEHTITISYFLKLDMDSFELTAPIVICSLMSAKK